MRGGLRTILATRSAVNYYYPLPLIHLWSCECSKNEGETSKLLRGLVGERLRLRAGLTPKISARLQIERHSRPKASISAGFTQNASLPFQPEIPETASSVHDAEKGLLRGA